MAEMVRRRRESDRARRIAVKLAEASLLVSLEGNQQLADQISLFAGQLIEKAEGS